MRVAIFGCGWLGRALAKKLQTEHTVFGAVRSEASIQKLQEENITAFQEPGEASIFWDAEVLVVSISPQHAYVETLVQLPRLVSPAIEQIILLSSISVYAEPEGVIDERSTLKSEGSAVRGEEAFKRAFPQGVIIRLGGLMGKDRIAGQWGSKNLEDSAVNYIHQADAVGIIEAVIGQKVQRETINAVAPKHPKRSAIYKVNGKAFGFALPQFEEGRTRVVSGKKSRKLLGYEYRFDDPMRFWSDIPSRCR